MCESCSCESKRVNPKSLSLSLSQLCVRVNRVRVNPKCRSCALIEVCVRIEACESEVSLVCVNRSVRVNRSV